MYSPQPEEDETTDDKENEETDWEHYDQDVTLTRKGKAKSMFNKEIIKAILENVGDDLKRVYKKVGLCKIKPRDIPKELNLEEIEFKHEAYKNEEGDVYIGEFRKNTTIREGRGILISREGFIYEGFWIDDRRFGFGRILIPNGNVYQGQWVNDQSSGKGVYSTVEGLTYKGDWKANKCHGHGYELYKDGSWFEGKFKDGEKNGKGHFKWADGKEYKGSFKNGSMDGYGEISWPDGRSYKGDWVCEYKEVIQIILN